MPDSMWLVALALVVALHLIGALVRELIVVSRELGDRRSAGEGDR